jgi:hypothetical protein
MSDKSSRRAKSGKPADDIREKIRAILGQRDPIVESAFSEAEAAGVELSDDTKQRVRAACRDRFPAIRQDVLNQRQEYRLTCLGLEIENLRSKLLANKRASALPVDFAAVRDYAARKLKKVQRRIVELVCDAGGISGILDVGTLLGWQPPYDDLCQKTLQRIRRNFERECAPWTIRRHDNQILIENKMA